MKPQNKITKCNDKRFDPTLLPSLRYPRIRDVRGSAFAALPSTLLTSLKGCLDAFTSQANLLPIFGGWRTIRNRVRVSALKTCADPNNRACMFGQVRVMVFVSRNDRILANRIALIALRAAEDKWCRRRVRRGTFTWDYRDLMCTPCYRIGYGVNCGTRIDSESTYSGAFCFTLTNRSISLSTAESEERSSPALSIKR